MSTLAPTEELAVEAPRGDAPQTLGRYKVLYELASGGMATVYLARSTGAGGFERMVAIKRCHAHLRRNPEFVEMFLDEARLAARIHHPNVVPVVDVGEDDSLYLVLEYIEGGGLSSLVRAAAKRGETMPLGVALRIAIDVLTGLHAAHELCDVHGHALNIVHRDVSPQNILVGIDGVSRITDFGIAKAEARASVTRDGQIKGKLAYMTPEQLTAGDVTRRADIFAVGVVLWESLTMHRLFGRSSDVETIGALLHCPIAAPSVVAPGVPAGVDAAVMRALARDPADRYATAAEFAEALESSGTPVASARAVSTFINALLGDALTKRRQLVRRLSDPATMAARSSDESHVRRAPRPAPRQVTPARGAAAVGGAEDTDAEIDMSDAELEVPVPTLRTSTTTAQRAARRALALARVRRRQRLMSSGAVALALAGLCGVIFAMVRRPPAAVARGAVATATAALSLSPRVDAPPGFARAEPAVAAPTSAATATAATAATPASQDEATRRDPIAAGRPASVRRAPVVVRRPSGRAAAPAAPAPAPAVSAPAPPPPQHEPPAAPGRFLPRAI